jgi:GTP:adenosylcobinamide-phosphate guanylyltransferase
MTSYKVNYIIVQAGGKGTRLDHLTQNKPKAIVPINNLPIVFHLFRKYPDKKFIIIGDYKHSVLEKYLEAFAKVQYMTVCTIETGTCAGIRKALSYIPDNTPFLLIWSDLILGDSINIEGLKKTNYIGIAKDFECRWSYDNSVFYEKSSKDHGVAGLFLFQDKANIINVPESGELVRYFSANNYTFQQLDLNGTKEIGTLDAINAEARNKKFRCRPFNKMEINGDTITKIPIDEQGKNLAIREIAWYKEAEKYGFEQIPDIISVEPFTMRLIDGDNIFRVKLGDREKKIVIDNIVTTLANLHNFKTVDCDCFSIKEAYYTKTMARLDSVRNLIPFADRREITINGIPCKNIYFYRKDFFNLVENNLYTTRFSFIHGDCTFSNTMVDKNLNVIFLDPRGYFGFTELYGDVAYDWAKVFYSLGGDYDQFNNGNFVLDIGDDSVNLTIESNGWRHLTDYYLSIIPDCLTENIRLIHAIIWLSLTTYIWEDYDSICGAFYNGLLLMNEFLEGHQND